MRESVENNQIAYLKLQLRIIAPRPRWLRNKAHRRISSKKDAVPCGLWLAKSQRSQHADVGNLRFCPPSFTSLFRCLSLSLSSAPPALAVCMETCAHPERA
eukprot:6178809-Pleurochrysis_carterae.AAC.1